MPVSENSFHEKSGDEPAGKIIQTDDPADIPAGLAIVPGTEIAFLEEAAGDIFSGQDESGINASPDRPGQPPGQAEDGSQQAACSIDGKHPQGSGSFQRHVPSLQGMEGSKQDFEAPAEDAAFEKVFD